MDLEERVGCGVLGYLIWSWLHGVFEEGCCLGCVVYVLVGSVGIGVLLHFLR